MPRPAPPPTDRGSFETSDGLTLYTQHWTPEGEPAAIVLLVHGYAEHSGRYDHVAETFVDRDAAVYAYDHRGHGRSEGRRAYVDRFEQYLEDLDRFRQHVQSQTPDVPVFLFGHSMGGLVSLLYVLNHAPNLRGLLLSAPAIEVNPDLAPLLRKIAQVLGRLFPTLPTVRSPQGSISRDPAVVEEAENDPLNYHGRTLARTGAELLRAGQAAQSRLHELDTPFLVLHGTADPLATPTWSKRLYERAAATDKTLRLYDGLYHETFNEPERDAVLRDLGTWLGERMPTDPSP
jgi:alpha-beta hydrolase superfamily lysophospholipase